MFKCRECKTVYKNKVDYCNCGNNVFEEIPDVVQPMPQKVSTEVKPVEVESVKMVTGGQILSYLIFGVCLVCSVLFVMFVGNPVEKNIEKPKAPVQNISKEIPSIDELWNDTPAYTVHANVSFESYIGDLKDVLTNHFNLPKFDGDGTCEVRFTVDSAGRLQDKMLVRNTANRPLENAAKKMLSNVKLVNPPPNSYTGTLIRFELVEFNNEYHLQYIE